MPPAPNHQDARTLERGLHDTDRRAARCSGITFSSSGLSMGDTQFGHLHESTHLQTALLYSLSLCTAPIHLAPFVALL